MSGHRSARPGPGRDQVGGEGPGAETADRDAEGRLPGPSRPPQSASAAGPTERLGPTADF
ncbi:hypothetical protein E4N62_10270 [Streptomyces sp. MNU76]|uniref:hypothetical protein n=1 Tax=Streptomyces sp. MNU76 TaxID=2560026 RepID=UPI001E5B4CE7|nr:hypothetical protein [Streptomyces sp. MNU76]MCC9705610.1 hypothetical protein [Streptomyces sp. MNU76]